MKTRNEESATAEQHQPMIVESPIINLKIPSTNKRPPSAAILLQTIEPHQKKPCFSFGTSDVLQIPDPERITVAKALTTRLSEVTLQDYKLHHGFVGR
jgi:hypothetical protein